jgi:PBSX family phage terminase large subunit
MLLSRLSLENSFLLGTTNPDTPSHWLVKNYLSRQNELDIKVWDFLLEDNHTLPKSYIENLKREYTGVFYDSFILGKWVAAKGLIYSKFANEKEKYIVDKIMPYDLQSVHVGIDYGASKSKTAFVAIGFTKGFRELYVLKEKTSLGIKTPEEMYKNFWSFYDELEKEYGQISFCYADWGGLGQVQTKGIQNYFWKLGKPIKIQDCFKVRIIERINMACRLIGSDRFKIHKDCKETIEALSSAVWEEKKDDVRLDNGSVNIDVLDAMEYAFSNYMQSLNNSFNRPENVDNMLVL